MTDSEKTVTYAGRRVTTRGTLAYFYAHPDGELRGYAKPLITGAKIGTEITVTAAEDGQFWATGPKAPRASGLVPETDPRLLEWSVDEKGDLTRAAQIREQQRIIKAGADPLRARLSPVREQLQAMSPDRRAAAAGWILTFLLGDAR